MYYVYILKSIKYSNKRYIGFTSNIINRLIAHNNGQSVYTNKFKPWFVETYICFSDRTKAVEFERYLKTGSGIAFARRHLISYVKKNNLKVGTGVKRKSL